MVVNEVDVFSSRTFVGCEVVVRSGFVGLGIWITPCLPEVQAFSTLCFLLNVYYNSNIVFNVG